MSNLISFINAFLSYFLLFGVIVVLVLIAVFLGTTMRQRKNAKENVAVIEADVTKSEE